MEDLMVEEAEYGSWTSPITAELLVATAATVTEVQVSEGTTWWSEARPSEAGRVQIVRLADGGDQSDVIPAGWSARTRVHEYGGGAWWVWGPTLFFVSWDDQRLYRVDPGGEPVPLTPEPDSKHALRYADGVVTPDGSWVVCVRERHPADGSEAVNEVVALDADPGEGPLAEPVVLVGGRDFVAAPRVSRDGRQLAWIAWDHPNMPWDGTELWVASLAEGPGWIGLDRARREAGDGRESLIQPVWGRHSSLFVVSDRSGWWNVHRVAALDHLEPVHEVTAEVGGPAWWFAESHLDIDRDGTVVATYPQGGSAQVLVAPEDGDARVVEVPCLAMAELRVRAGRATALATYVDREQQIVSFDLVDPASLRVLRPGPDSGVAGGLAPSPEALVFPSAGGRESHAWFFAPLNPEHSAPVGTLPPVIVNVHGGPTGSASPGYELGRLYWTSRGFAFVALDSGGSTGTCSTARGAWWTSRTRWRSCATSSTLAGWTPGARSSRAGRPAASPS
jgi:dipeptidyl aminopeptidase/acylaminoacyl peptidase